MARYWPQYYFATTDLPREPSAPAPPPSQIPCGGWGGRVSHRRPKSSWAIGGLVLYLSPEP